MLFINKPPLITRISSLTYFWTFWRCLFYCHPDFELKKDCINSCCAAFICRWAKFQLGTSCGVDVISTNYTLLWPTFTQRGDNNTSEHQLSQPHGLCYCLMFFSFTHYLNKCFQLSSASFCSVQFTVKLRYQNVVQLR